MTAGVVLILVGELFAILTNTLWLVPLNIVGGWLVGYPATKWWLKRRRSTKSQRK